MPIPEELKNNAQWCGWKYEMRDGRKTKVPYNPNTIEKAKSNDAETFGAFEDAQDAVLGGYVDGYGIRVFNGFSAIDIDHCVSEDGCLSDAAQEICIAMQSYAEKSPSGSGIRVIFKSPDFVYDKEKYYIKNPNNGIEIYTEGSTNRFVTITGNTVYGYPIRDNPEALQAILDKYMLRPAKKTSTTSTPSRADADLDEEQILSRAMRNYNFSTLFNGNMGAYKNDHSSADLALCNMLAFWTGKDPIKIDKIFRKSALYREKWERGDYRSTTIGKAIEDCTEVYNPYRINTIWDKLDAPLLSTENWTVDANGVSRTVIKNKKTGESETHIVTSTPIVPAAYLENSDTGDCKIDIHYLYNNQQRSFVCDKETVLNKAKIVKLANKGINVTSATANELTQFFSDMESLNANIIPHYLSTSHMGWNGNAFVPYDSNIKFDGEDENAALYQHIVQSGDLSEWVNYMSPLRKNLYFRLIMAASFASPLIQICGCLPFWFHLWGTSGTGKTVALMSAMSIWGDPKVGKLTHTLNATTNAMMSTVSFLCNIPFAGDELQTIRGSTDSFNELIMQLTEGVERNRMKYDKNLPSRHWHCAFLTTGEEPITSDNDGGGTKNRVIEVEIDNKFFGKQGNAIVSFILNNHGTAGPKFIEHIQRNITDLKPLYQTINSEIINTLDTTNKQAASATLILLADKLACESLFPNDIPLTISDIEPFVKMNAETDVSVRAYEWAKSWLAQYQNKFSDNQYSEVWGKTSHYDNSVFVIASVLKFEMSKAGFSFDAVKKKWADNGWIRKHGKGYTKYASIYNNKAHCVEFIL